MRHHWTEQWDMELVYLRDKQGNLLRPKPLFVETKHGTMEISQIPYYIWMPVRRGETLARRNDDGKSDCQ